MSTLEMEAEYDAIQQTYAAEKNRCISIMEQAEVVIAENIAQMPQDLPPIEQGHSAEKDNNQAAYLQSSRAYHDQMVAQMPQDSTSNRAGPTTIAENIAQMPQDSTSNRAGPTTINKPKKDKKDSQTQTTPVKNKKRSRCCPEPVKGKPWTWTSDPTGGGQWVGPDGEAVPQPPLRRYVPRGDGWFEPLIVLPGDIFWG